MFAAAETWQAVAGLGTMVAAVVGLYFLIVELRALQRSVQGSAHAAIYAQAADFRAHLVERPHLRKYFFDGAELEADHAEYDRVVTIAELFLNYLEYIAVMGDAFGKQNRAALDRFTRASLERSPVLRQRLRANPAGYSDALHRHLEGAGGG
jgi:hypothetical protein